MDNFDFLNGQSSNSFNIKKDPNPNRNDGSDPFSFDIESLDQFSSELNRVDNKYSGLPDNFNGNTINNNNNNNNINQHSNYNNNRQDSSGFDNRQGYNANGSSPFDINNIGEFEMNNNNNETISNTNNNNNNNNNNGELSQTLNIDDFMSAINVPNGNFSLDYDGIDSSRNNNNNINTHNNYNDNNDINSHMNSSLRNGNNVTTPNIQITGSFSGSSKQDVSNTPRQLDSFSSSYNDNNNSSNINNNMNSFKSPRVSVSSHNNNMNFNNPQYFSPSLRPASLSTSVNKMARRSGSISNADNTGRSYSSQLGTSLNNIISPASTYSGFEDSPYGSYQSSFNDSYLKSPMNSPSFKAIGSPASMSSHMNPKNIIQKENKLNRRRELHNAVERRRRDLIKEKIKELGTLIPPSLLTLLTKSKSGHAKEIKANKSLILNKSVDYIKYLQEIMQSQDDRLVVLTNKIEELQKLSEGKIDSETYEQNFNAEEENLRNIGQQQQQQQQHNHQQNSIENNTQTSNSAEAVNALNLDQFNFNLDEPQFIKQESQFGFSEFDEFDTAMKGNGQPSNDFSNF